MCPTRVIEIYNWKQSIDRPGFKLLGFSKWTFYGTLWLPWIIYCIFYFLYWQITLFLCRLAATNLWNNELNIRYAIVKGVFFLLLLSFGKVFFGQSGEAFRWRVCYQRGLPRLVITAIRFCIFIFCVCLFICKTTLVVCFLFPFQKILFQRKKKKKKTFLSQLHILCLAYYSKDL